MCLALCSIFWLVGVVITAPHWMWCGLGKTLKKRCKLHDAFLTFFPNPSAVCGCFRARRLTYAF